MAVEPETVTSDYCRPGRGPVRQWTVGPYQLEAWPWRGWSWRFAVRWPEDLVTVGGYRTPWGAWLAMRRYRRGDL